MYGTRGEGDGRTEEQKKKKWERKTKGQKNRKKGNGKGRLKDRRTEDRRTKEQKQVERGTGARGKKGQKATTEAAQSGDWKVVAYLESVANSYGWRVKPNARYAFRAHGLAMT